MNIPKHDAGMCSPPMIRTHVYKKQSGMSLIELLVTLSVISILAVMAAPGVQTMIENNQAHSVTSDFLNSLYRARSEAVKRGNLVTLCASNADQTACDNTADGDFSDGWIVFTDYDNDKTVDGANILFDTTGDGNVDSPEQIIYASGEPAGNFVIEYTGIFNELDWSISYNTNGLPIRGTGDTRININPGYRISKSGHDDTQLSRITIARTGRIRSCVGDIDKCPAP